jgi:hypothetical protein
MNGVVQIDDLILLAGSSHRRMCEIAIANGLVIWPKPDQDKPEKAQGSH